MASESPIRTFVTFNADVPDDGIFDSEGNCVTPAGKVIAETLVSALRDRGAAVTDVVQHSFYGWQFTAEMNKSRAWFLLQCPGPWLLLSQPRLPLFQRLLSRGGPLHRSLLRVVNDCLVQDSRFTGARWYTKKEYEGGNARGPGEDQP